MVNQTLYQIDSKGRIKIWKIWLEVLASHVEIHIESGKLHGKLAKTITKVTKGKNIGKVNETTPETQAISDIKSKVESKLKQGYVKDVSHAKPQTELGTGIKQPMLAHKYDPTKKQKGSKNLIDLKLEGKKVYVQPKLDGLRGIFHVTKNSIVLYSRKGERLPVLAHLETSLFDSFQKHFPNIEELWLDGELYTNAFPFNQLSGLIKKEKKTTQRLELCKTIEYHLYDIQLEEIYEKRQEILKKFESPVVKIVPTTELIATEETLKNQLELCLAGLYEGLMIRTVDVPYIHKRTWNLIKYKIFEDAEFECIGFEESKRGGMAGAIICKTKEGKEFNAGLTFSHTEAKEMWENQEKYIGRSVTVHYFGISEYNIPRFPKAKTFRID